MAFINSDSLVGKLLGLGKSSSPTTTTSPTTSYTGEDVPVDTPSQVAARLSAINPSATATSVVQPGVSYYQPPAPVTAPKLDIVGLQAQARTNAENSVNPYYQKALSDYLAKEAFNKSVQEQQTQTAITNYEDTLKNILEGNATTGERTTQDVAKNIGDINTKADQFQTDSGQAFDAARIAEAKRAAVAGTTGGTAAAGQESLQTNNAITEQRQTDQFQEAKAQAELFKNRTFEDIAKSNAQATTSKEKNVKAAQFNLDTFLKNQQFDEQQTRNDLEKSRLGDIATNQQSQASLLYYDYLSKISDPLKYLAAVKTYGGAF